MTLSNVISRCIDQWQAEGLALAPPIDVKEVRRVWSTFDMELSADVLQLYTTVGGFQEYILDKQFYWSFWPWDLLKQSNKGDSEKKGVMFCDHSIEIVTWQLRYEGSQHSSVWSCEGNKTAPTLEAFLKQYLDNPWQLM